MRLYEKIKAKLNDPLISYEERTLILMAFLAVTAMSFACLFDILSGENIVEIITLIIMIIGVPIVTGISVAKNKILMGTLLQVISLVFIILPVAFFFGGGPEGGGVFWVIFTYMFIGLSLSGGPRVAMVICHTLITVGEYMIWFYFPDLIVGHTRDMFFSDALSSIILVGFSTFAMLRYQKLIFNVESKRAQEQAKRAEELNRSQNQFFSSMSHEIRTPINSILGLNELILRQEDASNEIRKDATQIQGAGKMLLTLVNDILDLSKIRAGKMEIVPVNYKVPAMLSDIVNMIWHSADQKGLKLNVNIDPSIPSELYGDEVRIKQILVNLLNNAVKYTNEGTITLHMEKEMESEDKVHIVFSVADTGIGIKQDSLPYLFDAFRRTDEKKNKDIEGTGLGLSIVKQLVDLMEGTISVDSVYSQGSTFSVALWQAVTNRAPIGAIKIFNYGESGSFDHYESSFVAPDARILIVDDNEMNLEVEKRLLTDTQMTIETATSGMEALQLTAKIHYDVVLMDHLMPGMNGIECLLKIRRQKEDVNNNTPVIALTANAGSENKELYSRSGFDGYLLKPVSGRQLEETLLSVLPAEKVRLKGGSDFTHEVMNTASGYRRKVPILITTNSMCDLPTALIREMQLDIIPFFIHTDHGAFYDNVETDADELVYFMENVDSKLLSEPPRVEDFEEFFAQKLNKAHQILHIALTPGLSEEYSRATRAAQQFDNVTVIDSGSVSSCTGILVMVAYQMVQKNMPLELIIQELNEVKKRTKISFVVSDTQYMVNNGYVSDRMHRLMALLNIRPSLTIKNNAFCIDWAFIGEKQHCFLKYIQRTLPKSAKPDTDIVFVPYVGLSDDELTWIEAQIRKRFYFKHILFQKGSSAISVNSGPGTFGILYLEKGEKSYHLGSMIPSEKKVSPEYVEDEPAVRESIIRETREEPEEAPRKWYENIPGIDADYGLKNSGSEDSFLAVLKIFYDNIPENHRTIQEFFDSKDYENYTIKVHALKSSAKLVGAMKLSEDAQEMENAGKMGDPVYIHQHHQQLMSDYLAFKEILAPYLDETPEDSEDTAPARDKPVADTFILGCFYDSLLKAARAGDDNLIEASFREIEDYAIPEDEAPQFNKVREAFDKRDYESIISALS